MVTFALLFCFLHVAYLQVTPVPTPAPTPAPNPLGDRCTSNTQCPPPRNCDPAWDGFSYCCAASSSCGGTPATACFSCSANGNCASNCASPTGCFGNAICLTAGVSIPCTSRIAGWSTNGLSCERWASVGQPRCAPGGACASATDVNLCSTAAASTPNTRVVTATVDDLACRNNAKCQPNDLVTESDTTSEIGSTGSACTTGAGARQCFAGRCLLVNGQTCTAASDCGSGF